MEIITTTNHPHITKHHSVVKPWIPGLPRLVAFYSDEEAVVADLLPMPRRWKGRRQTNQTYTVWTCLRMHMETDMDMHGSFEDMACIFLHVFIYIIL